MDLRQLFRKCKTRFQSRWQGELRYLVYKTIYKNPGRPAKELEINIDDIKMVIDDRSLSRKSPAYRKIYKTVNTVIDGAFWDHVKPINANNVKLVGFREHFILGIEWKETSLFKKYEQELSEKPNVQGCGNISELIALYEKKYDALYHQLALEGVKSAHHNVDITPIYIYLHSDGSFVYTSGGNHRLNMAKVLGLKRIPVRVRGRHAEWQRVRDEYRVLGPAAFEQKYPSLASHPDLQI